MLVDRENLKREVKRSMSRLVAESLNDIEIVLGSIESVIDSNVVDVETQRKLEKLKDVYDKIRTKIMYVNSTEMKRMDKYIGELDVSKCRWEIVYFND